MTSKHTPGPAHTGGTPTNPTIVYDKDGWAICSASTFHGRHDGPATAAANARRIAACWNAFRAFPTRQIEELAVDLAALQVETDSLLDVLRKCADFLDELTDGDGGGEASMTLASQARAVIDKTRQRSSS
ncbi:MAG: hypothetical protein ABI574_13260 [Burkholderiales bacterium]